MLEKSTKWRSACALRLKNLVIGKRVETIGAKAFSRRESLKKVNFKGNAPAHDQDIFCKTPVTNLTLDFGKYYPKKSALRNFSKPIKTLNTILFLTPFFKDARKNN